MAVEMKAKIFYLPYVVPKRTTRDVRELQRLRGAYNFNSENATWLKATRQLQWGYTKYNSTKIKYIINRNLRNIAGKIYDMNVIYTQMHPNYGRSFLVRCMEEALSTAKYDLQQRIMSAQRFLKREDDINVMLSGSEIEEYLHSDKFFKYTFWEKFLKHYRKFTNNLVVKLVARKKQIINMHTMVDIQRDSTLMLLLAEINGHLNRLFQLVAETRINSDQVMKYSTFKMEYAETEALLQGFLPEFSDFEII